jgi:metal-sulfur cluster biosynthetic enzyme
VKPEAEELARAVWAAIATVKDPEIPVSLVDLGLVYGVEVDGDAVRVAMTLTSTACACAGWIVDDVRQAVTGVPGVRAVHVELVWDPPWDRSRVTARGSRELQRWGIVV